MSMKLINCFLKFKRRTPIWQFGTRNIYSSDEWKSIQNNPDPIRHFGKWKKYTDTESEFTVGNIRISGIYNCMYT